MGCKLYDKWKDMVGEEGLITAVKGEKTSKDAFSRNRRTVLKAILAQVALGPLAMGGALAAPKNFDPSHYAGNRDVSPGQIPRAKGWLVTDPMLCVGCRTCEMICSMVHDSGCNPELARVHVNSDPLGKLSHISVLPEVCRQCNEPDCFLACAYGAQVIDEKTGARVIIADKCTGCRECYDACPWDMITYDEETNKASKCDLCGGAPQCVLYCPAGAIKYVAL